MSNNTPPPRRPGSGRKVAPPQPKTTAQRSRPKRVGEARRAAMGTGGGTLFAAVESLPKTFTEVVLPRIAPFFDKMGVWARNWGAIILIPCWIITILTLGQLLGTAAELSLWRSEKFWFFVVGSLMAGVQFYLFYKPITFYVLGHETTHWLFTKLCFGKIHEFKVSRQGGYVVASKTNWLISLSPYFFPIYAVVAALLFWGWGKFVDFSYAHPLGLTLLPYIKLSWLSQMTLGCLWGFHIFFTIWMIRKEQPDLAMNNVFFSVNLILLANLLVLCGMVVAITPGMSGWRLGGIWWDSADKFLEYCGMTVVRVYQALAH